MTTIFKALKRIKHIDRKIEANQKRVQRWCSHDEEEQSPYEMRNLLQSITDLATEKARIRAAIHATNVNTVVEFKGKPWTIDALLCQLNIILPKQIESLHMLRRKERSRWDDDQKVKYVIEYDPKERDDAIEKIQEDILLIHDLLDETNLTTKLTVKV